MDNPKAGDETMTINLPAGLAREVRTYIQSGWAPDLNALIIEAVRRYLETHETDLQERFLQEDVEWGLHGNE